VTGVGVIRKSAAASSTPPSAATSESFVRILPGSMPVSTSESEETSGWGSEGSSALKRAARSRIAGASAPKRRETPSCGSCVQRPKQKLSIWSAAWTPWWAWMSRGRSGTIWKIPMHCCSAAHTTQNSSQCRRPTSL
tara:strand:- start:247 stop:657 length:411 start_codon:yes stop_codon:yes gene_type:complete